MDIKDLWVGVHVTNNNHTRPSGTTIKSATSYNGSTAPT